MNRKKISANLTEMEDAVHGVVNLAEVFVLLGECHPDTTISPDAVGELGRTLEQRAEVVKSCWQAAFEAMREDDDAEASKPDVEDAGDVGEKEGDET